MARFETVLVACLFLGLASAQTCSDIILDDCNLPEGEIITSVRATSEKNCGDFCGLYGACETWCYSSQIVGDVENCQLVSMDIVSYLKSCMLVGGEDALDFGSCINSANPTAGYSSGGCSYSGNVIDTLPSIKDWATCEGSSKISEQGVHWLYEIESKTCTLYGADAGKSCNIACGPNPHARDGM